MNKKIDYDAIVVGAGPNGLAAAIRLAQAGWAVLLVEAKDTVGGGTRTAELTLPGFRHDVCAAIHSLAVTSPFFRTLPLAENGLKWIYPPASLAHPLDDGTAILVERSVEATAEQLGRDGPAYRRLMTPFVEHWDQLSAEILGPLRLPRFPLPLMRFGLLAIWPAHLLGKQLFKGERARAWFGGMAAHSIQSLRYSPTAAFGLVLGTSAHAAGWPLAEGGSQKIADALACHLRALGGEIVTGFCVDNADQLPPARAVLFDVTPRQFVNIMGDRLEPGYRQRLEDFRYGPGVFKIDYALDGPIPWKAKECNRSATLHLGGTFEEIVAAEHMVWKGGIPDQPFVLLAQQSQFDPQRAPDGKQTAWVYCHVPNGSNVDMTSRIEGQIERFAPGFRDLILARSVQTPADLERYNPNYIGGDINGGVQDLPQLWTRPVARWNPYTTPVKGVYLCSSSTPPAGGVHGMSGFFAAETALKRA